MNKDIDAITETNESRIYGGYGVRVQRRSSGTIVSMRKRTFSWDHPFGVRAYHGTAIITLGLVNGMIPTINGKPMIRENGIPETLKLKNFKGTSSYVALEVINKSNPVDKTTTIASIEIVHVQYLGDNPINQFFGGALGYPNLANGGTRYPLAMLNDVRFGRAVFQIAYFNLNYRTVPSQKKKPKHYFFPA